MKKQIQKPAKLHVRTGDLVKVIAGDDKGKTGRILSVDREKQRAIVEELNKVSRHVKPSAQNPNGGIITKEAPIHISNLMLVNPATNEPTKIGRRRNDNGKLQRFSKKTGEFIPTTNNG
jgi:large subunit ribosomal protein L24